VHQRLKPANSRLANWFTIIVGKWCWSAAAALRAGGFLLDGFPRDACKAESRSIDGNQRAGSDAVSITACDEKQRMWPGSADVHLPGAKRFTTSQRHPPRLRTIATAAAKKFPAGRTISRVR